MFYPTYTAQLEITQDNFRAPLLRDFAYFGVLSP